MKFHDDESLISMKENIFLTDEENFFEVKFCTTLQTTLCNSFKLLLYWGTF